MSADSFLKRAIHAFDSSRYYVASSSSSSSKRSRDEQSTDFRTVCDELGKHPRTYLQLVSVREETVYEAGLGYPTKSGLCQLLDAAEKDVRSFVKESGYKIDNSNCVGGGIEYLTTAADVLGEELDTESSYCQPISAVEEILTYQSEKSDDSEREVNDVRKCSTPGCLKFPQSSTPFCISHGGGRRCLYQGCNKAARDQKLCAAHGGGKRCTAEGCNKSAVGGSGLCSYHGGGKKCSWQDGCSKAAQSATPFCVTHGGGKRCGIGGCHKVARGKTLFCSAHGGGVRCTVTYCGRAVINKTKFCRLHLISDSPIQESTPSL